jgi:hypothetical protein
MVVEQKPYQIFAWIATAFLIGAAAIASLYPSEPMYFDLPGNLHHYAFTVANFMWVAIGILWKEKSLITLNAGLTIIYLVGLLAQ